MLNESVKKKIEEAAHNYLHEIRGDDKPTWQSEVMFDSGILKTFKSGSKFGYQLASDENDAIIKKLNSEYADACKPHEDRDLKIYFLQNENSRLKEKLNIAVAALIIIEDLEPINERQRRAVSREALKQIRDDKEME